VTERMFVAGGFTGLVKHCSQNRPDCRPLVLVGPNDDMRTAGIVGNKDRPSRWASGTAELESIEAAYLTKSWSIRRRD